jgi:hypothetical protein
MRRFGDIRTWEALGVSENAGLRHAVRGATSSSATVRGRCATIASMRGRKAASWEQPYMRFSVTWGRCRGVDSERWCVDDTASRALSRDA